MICPDCNGKKQVFSMVCGRYSSGGGFSRNGLADCRTCDGTGEISKARVDAITEGQRRRDDRVARGVSQREEAKRLGITPTCRCHFGFGRL